MKELTAKQVEELVTEGNQSLNIIDVREDEEVASGMIPAAKHIPLGSIESRMGELDKTKEYIMVCRSGGRSGQASQFLESQGFNVINMTGGMMSWEGPTK
ncbi:MULTISPECIES: rhodanese-like domain-containing protein [Rossellomorea]|uniref:Rhodanese-like domain-containing protein n=1 Tax=Rossellomorea vietnamensis TaxID=218284 RepID=A0ACD4C8E9_9BACI|nr:MULTISPECIES: rhodanese-like domain-containing protein [Rossellomorea]MCA0148140.1 rhodanese-like domain-containing protein [Rossellomorea vietnamensis]UTE75847.1 rhodanese-like domain-containing protein [Rossellomorea sp. KS-H15a]UXH44954.1 rhodanese-like domain-containing protein [Rossellomorea vietnamensis]WGG43677.1 rhodanese-like domain-containing protein [Rossellomorea sp. DA94]WQI96311.1 rhodanese-like domain-containing protein [Rossellomorea vietnamensis]